MNSLRILVPLDDSLQAQRVLGYASALAALSDGKLKLIRATDVEDDTSFNSLAQNAERLRASGLSVEWSVVGNIDAMHAIETAAGAWRPDLIALASTKSSAPDRWLNGSVTEQVVRSATVPVLVVPPGWERLVVHDRRIRILVPLDGSGSAEEALALAIRLADLVPSDVVLLRAVHTEIAISGAEDYLHQIAARVEAVLPPDNIFRRVVTGSPVSAILSTAEELDVDVIAMSTRGHGGAHRPIVGNTATEVFDQATVPLLLLGPRALLEAPTDLIKIGAQARTLDDQHAGEVHRIVVDLEQQALVAMVLLGRGGLARDVLVPVDFRASLAGDEVQLRLTSEQLAELPDFSYNEFVTPPPTWTSSAPGPVTERKRLGPTQRDITSASRVLAQDGEIGRVAAVESDPETRSLRAFWVRADGIFSRETRIPAEWVQHSDEQGNLRVARNLADVESYVAQD
jgi:nucleotide-binding universal stress UspA family protein